MSAKNLGSDCTSGNPSACYYTQSHLGMTPISFSCPLMYTGNLELLRMSQRP